MGPPRMGPPKPQDMLAGLAEGRPFTALLEPFAPNDAIAEGDGVVGWFNYADAERRFLIPRRIFFALDVDQVSEPVRLPRGWQIFRFLDERTPDPACRPRDYDAFVLDFHGGRIGHSRRLLAGCPGMGIMALR